MISENQNKNQVRDAKQTLNKPDDMRRALRLLVALGSPFTGETARALLHRRWEDWYLAQPTAFRQEAQARYAAWREQNEAVS